ncbi:MAG: serine/threonine-protein kinase [Cyanobacteria bacterium P01_D01_bin.105]
MQLYCTRPNCPSPLNSFPSLDNPKIPRPIKQKYCSACRMEMVLGGRYLPVGVLGQGGFGTAFLARDIDSPTKRKCVVKLFQPPVTLTSAQMATAQRLFATEAEVLERFGLQHPQIPNLYAYFPLLITNPLTNQTEELFYLVQEFVDGEDLEKILDREGAFSESDVTEVLTEILRVLDFVHSNGAIHRDVKPSNIMKGRNGKLYLLDFGAVKEVAKPSGVQRGPTTICSPDYAPPEQIMNGTVGATSDLYALAASCVVLLTHKGSNELRDSSTNRWRWHSQVTVSDRLASILDKMLEARPDRRFPSAEAVLAALAGVSSAVQRPSAAYPNPSQGVPSIGMPVSPPPMPAAAKAAPVPSLAKSVVPPPSGAAKLARSPSVKPATPRSLMQFLGSAAFTGVEGGLLAIATFSLIETVLFGGGVWLAMLVGLILLQVRRTIEGWDFLIIVGVTLAGVIFIAPLNSLVGGQLGLIVVASIMAGGVMVLIAALFRLIFQLLSRIM